MIFFCMSVVIRKWWISVYLNTCSVMVWIQSITSVTYNNLVLNLVCFVMKQVWKQCSQAAELHAATFAYASQSGTSHCLKQLETSSSLHYRTVNGIVVHFRDRKGFDVTVRGVWKSHVLYLLEYKMTLYIRCPPFTIFIFRKLPIFIIARFLCHLVFACFMLLN